MTTEEKARAYDEALNKIKPLYEQAKRDGNPIWSTYEYLFPQLAESEDEKARKWIYDFIRNCPNETFEFYGGVGKKAVLAYLEKQKEPHYTKRNALFDKCVENCDPKIMQKVSDEVDEILEKEQKPAEWNPNNEDVTLFNKAVTTNPNLTPSERAKLDIIRMKFKRCNGNTANPAEWSEEDEDAINGAIGILLDDNNPSFVFPEHSKLSVGEIVKRLKSLRPQSKKELSIEKAIQWLDDTFYFLNNSSGRGRDCEITTHDFDSLEEMYDSFRKAVTVDSEPSWKPSEEQMEALKNSAYGSYQNGDGPILRELYEQLKKLI